MPNCDSYITRIMTEAPDIKRCAIVSYNDGELWYSATGDTAIQSTEDELSVLLDAFAAIEFPATMMLEGASYKVSRVDGRWAIRGRREGGGFCAVRGNMAVLIAVFEGEEAIGKVYNTLKNTENFMVYGMGF